MRIETMNVGFYTVLAPKESLTFQNCKELEGKVQALMEQRKGQFVLDLKAVPYLDSEALELFARLQERLAARGGNLRIVGTGAVCRDILVATRLINVLSVYEDMHELVRSQT